MQIEIIMNGDEEHKTSMISIFWFQIHVRTSLLFGAAGL